MICYDSSGRVNFNIKSKLELFNFIKNNLYDLYNPSGKYFDIIYQAVSNTSNRGKKIEKIAFLYFKNIVKLKKKIDIEIVEPTLNEDIGGIDGIFYLNNKKYTIQVKPLFRIEDYKKDNEKFIVFCDGVLKELKTDYLIVSNDNDTYCFRNPIIDGKRSINCIGSYFLVNKSI